MSLFEGVELTSEQQAAVQANADKQYQGFESPEQIKGLKDKNDQLIGEQREAARIAKESADNAETARLETARGKGDIKALEESWATKQAESDAKYETLLKQNETSAIDASVSKLAAELGGDNAALLEPHLRQRMRYEDGKVKVTDVEGSLTVSTMADLAKEFKNNPMFASAIVGTRADGGGATNNSNGSGGAGPSSKSFTAMSLKEQTEHLRSKQ